MPAIPVTVPSLSIDLSPAAANQNRTLCVHRSWPDGDRLCVKAAAAHSRWPHIRGTEEGKGEGGGGERVDHSSST